VKNEELRGFDVFFCVLFAIGREKKCVKDVQVESRQPRSSPFGLEVPGGFL